MAIEALKVFLSWSGDQSRIVAEGLKILLKRVVQTCDPFMSAKDIEGGTKWVVEISNHLQKTGIGVICITPENQHKPWLNFEAGAISTFAGHLKEGEKIASRVCPYLLDLKPEEVEAPLGIFHAKTADRDGTKELIQMVNRQAPMSLSETDLEDTFYRIWPDFEKQLGVARKVAPSSTPAKRSETDLLGEVLSVVRRIERQLAEAEARGSRPVPSVSFFSGEGAGLGLPLSGISAANVLASKGPLAAPDYLGVSPYPGASASPYRQDTAEEQARRFGAHAAIAKFDIKKKPEGGGEKD